LPSEERRRRSSYPSAHGGIWFAEHGGHFYLVAERESANWVRNTQSQPQVKVRVGDAEFDAIASVVHNNREPHLTATVKALFDAKYGWSDGPIVELTPAQESPHIEPPKRIAGTVDRTRPEARVPESDLVRAECARRLPGQSLDRGKERRNARQADGQRAR
jgi:hypothetical protein